MPLRKEPCLWLPVLNACLHNAGSYTATNCHPATVVAPGFAATRVFINHQAASILQSDGLSARAECVTRLIDLGHRVSVVEKRPEKPAVLRRGETPIL
jgi:hypothetical protein